MRPSALRPWCALLAAAAVAAAPAGGGVPARDPLPGTVQPDAGADPAASRNGRVAAFAASWRDAGGGLFTEAGDPTVFLWDRRLGLLRQLTSAGPSDQPSVENATLRLEIGANRIKDTRARTVVAFRSTGNPTGGNGDGTSEIFLWDSGAALAQLTSSAEGISSHPSVGARFEIQEDAAGRPTGNLLLRTRTAFLSTSNLAGDNPDGRAEIFLHDSGADAVARIRQLTFTTVGDAGPPASSRDGRRTVFVHDGDPVPGEDPVPGGAVYAHDTRGGLWRVSGAESVDPADPVLDQTGRWAAWSAIPSGGGSRTIFVAHLARGTVRRLEMSEGVSRRPSLGRGGRRVAFLTTASLTGAGGPVPERPVVIDVDGRYGAVPSAGAEDVWSAPRLLRGIPRLVVSTTADLGDNPSGRVKLYYVRPDR